MYQRRPSIFNVTTTNECSLKAGPRVNVFLGAGDSQALIIENAYANVLKQYSDLAKDALAGYGSARFTIKEGNKHIISWIYRYMLAGEKDTDLPKKFSDLAVSELALLRNHCEMLRYESLASKTLGRIKYMWYHDDEHSWDYRSVINVALLVPAMHSCIAESMAEELVSRVWTTDEKYDDHVEALLGMPVLGDKIRQAVVTKIESSIEKANWFYAQPFMQRDMDFCNMVYYRKQSMTRNPSRPPTKNNHVAVPTAPKVTAPLYAAMAKAVPTKARTVQNNAQVVQTEAPVINGKATAVNGKTVTHVPNGKDPVIQGKASTINANTVQVKSPETSEVTTVDAKIKPHTDSASKTTQRAPKSKNTSRKGKTIAATAASSIGGSSISNAATNGSAISTNVPRNNDTNIQVKRRPYSKDCFNCGKAGHIARNCTAGQHSRSTSPGTTYKGSVQEPKVVPTCFNCHRSGHRTHNCVNKEIAHLAMRN
jgi:hypothetical protein